MKKSVFDFAFLPKIKTFFTTLHVTQERTVIYIIRQIFADGKSLPILYKQAVLCEQALLQIKKQLLPVLFPRHCPLCHKLVPYGSFIHEECHRELPLIHSSVCMRCGKPVASPTQEYCYDCRTFPKSFQKGLSLFLYNKKTRPIMSAFKYQNRRGLADFFHQELCRYRLTQLRNWDINAVVPVPIHKNKYKKRGYNQAALLSNRLAVTLNLPHYPNMLIRSVDTLPQKQFNPQARLNNLKKAFRFNSRYDKLLSQSTPFSVLLVDDIYTSGATMEACTRILLDAGVSKVYVLSICIGIARD